MMPRHAYTPAEYGPPLDSSPVLDATVGSEVAATADQIEWLDMRVGALYEAEAARLNEEVLAEVGVFRNQLKQLAPAQQKIAEPYIQALLPEDWHYWQPDDDGRPTVASLSYLGDAEMVIFMRANVDAIAQQETDMAGFIAESKETFIDGLEKGIANEWVSPKAAGLKDKVIASPVRVYDWMTIAQNNDEFGRYDYATNMTLLSQGLGTSAEARNADFMEKHHETLPHEWWHGFDLSHEELPYDIGWLVEAGAEHCAQSFRYGSPDVIDPNDRGETAPVLGGCRALAAEMMNGLDTALFTRAVTSGSTRTAEWQAFTQAVDKKYGMNDAIRHISDRQVDYWYMCHDGQKDRTEVTRQAALAVRDELHEEPWKVAGTFVPVANTGTFVAEPLTERNRN